MNLPKLSNYVPYLSKIVHIAKKRNVNVWLVGGFIRDFYLKINKEFFDFDFCIEKDIISFVKEFSLATSSKFIVLDEENLSLRIIIKRNNIYNYDFTLMRGKNFIEDLLSRDFSINTLAIKLTDKTYTLIDYFDGQKDLENRIIRIVRDDTFLKDPLRILRAFSFMVNYGFRIDKNTKNAIVKYRGFLKNVSGERINEELFKILASRNSYKGIKLMSELKVIDKILPHITRARGIKQGSYHHLDVWQHSLETLYRFETFYNRKLSKDKDINDYLNKEVIQNKRRIQIIKLACILHDIGKPIAKRRKGKKTIFYGHEKIGRDLIEDIAIRLKLATRIKEILQKLIFWHLRPGYLVDQNKPSNRAVYRFFRDTETEGVGVLLLSLADWQATRGPLTDTKKRKKHQRIILKLIKNYFTEKKKKPLIKLVDGYDIMKKFNISPSPLVGKILKKIKEEQMLGNIKTKQEAFEIAKQLINRNNEDTKY